MSAMRISGWLCAWDGVVALGEVHWGVGEVDERVMHRVFMARVDGGVLWVWVGV